MADKEYKPPILVSASEGIFHIAYDEVSVDFPPDGPAPEGAPPLACRIFEAARHDLGPEFGAE